jgi:hypothetical protein
MNKNNTTTPAIVAIFMIATLVIGATFAARTATTQLAFAAVSKKGVGGQQQENSKNGNTVTIDPSYFFNLMICNLSIYTSVI